MKYGIFILMLAIAWIPAWGQNVDEFQFVSVMYPAVAAFNTIDVYNKTTFGHQGQTDNVYVNMGSKVAEGGTINIEGNPIEVTSLELAGSTHLNVTGPNWFVNTLNLHSGATVKVGTLIANDVSLKKETTLEVSDTILINGNAYTTTGSAISKLYAMKSGEGAEDYQFRFVSVGEDTGDATWKRIAKQTGETETAKADTHYPIYK